MKDLKVVERVTYEALEDFSNENTKYLELRTTPKSTETYTKHEYIETILECISVCKSDFNFVDVNLIISVDRSQPLSEAYQNLEIAKKYKFDGTPGLDFSGNPTINSFKDYEKIFYYAKENGLFTTIHTGELLNEKETNEIIEFRPSR
jgi:adenosine deaminase